MPLPGRAALGPVFIAWLAISVVGANGCAVVGVSAVEDLPDAGPHNDAATSGVTPTGSDASACSPGDVGAFQPDPYRSATAAWQNVCRPDQITAFYDACLGANASATACNAFKGDTTTSRCAACILTPDTLPHYGPLIDHRSFITTNVAGCIELTDPQGLLCARSLQALGACELAACQANCPVADTASRASYDACAAQADNGGCDTYTTLATTCVNAENDAGLVSDCLIATFADFYAAVVPLFCGAPEVDASVPPFDASAGFDASPAPSDAAGDEADGRLAPPPLGEAGPGGGGPPVGVHDAALE
ncbi:MAG TPA: hypothetical protein VGM06_21750 [Polyangiaceae bacterium]|jgi:hypothetical protein